MKTIKKVVQDFKLRAFGIKPKANSTLTHTPTLSTTVPRSFEKDFKVWDKEKFKNITYID